jgi:hypothetical protein
MEREALKLALDALENHCGNYKLDDAGCDRHDKAITAIKAALAQPAQEPVALVIDGVLVKSALPEKYTGHLYTTPPKREWVGLTEKEAKSFISFYKMDIVRFVEAALKDKNNGT